jgi:flagellar basal body-associated protein FliL
MNVLLLLTIFALLGYFSVNGQEMDEQDAASKAQQAVMNQEVIEALWNILSPTCKTEMETALGNKGDISPACKSEVQAGLVSLKVIPDSPQRQQEAGFENSPPSEKSEGRSSKTPISPASEGASRSIIMAIVAFVVVLFGAAAGYIMYVNGNKGEGSAEGKAKKLSRKKVIFNVLSNYFLSIIQEEKLRQKRKL